MHPRARLLRRWRNQLDPTLKDEPWTAEEDHRLQELRAVHGNAWRLLAEMLPGRCVRCGDNILCELGASAQFV